MGPPSVEHSASSPILQGESQGERAPPAMMMIPNFSIRDFTLAIRKRDIRKTYPFMSAVENAERKGKQVHHSASHVDVQLPQQTQEQSAPHKDDMAYSDRSTKRHNNGSHGRPQEGDYPRPEVNLAKAFSDIFSAQQRKQDPMRLANDIAKHLVEDRTIIASRNGIQAEFITPIMEELSKLRADLTTFQLSTSQALKLINNVIRSQREHHPQDLNRISALEADLNRVTQELNKANIEIETMKKDTNAYDEDEEYEDEMEADAQGAAGAAA